MSDGVTAVMSRISQIRSAFGGRGGVLGVSGQERFDDALRTASGRSATRTSASGRTGSDPLDRLLTGRARAGALRSESSTWPQGVPEEAEQYAEEFIAASEETGVPLRILLAVAWAESGFDPDAVSGAGAQGMMQLMPGTAAGLGVDPTDPAQNILGGARYLAAQYEAFGSWDLAFAAYNAGPGAVQQYGGIPPYSETRNYVSVINGYLDRIGVAPSSSRAAAFANQAAALVAPMVPHAAAVPTDALVPQDGSLERLVPSVPVLPTTDVAASSAAGPAPSVPGVVTTAPSATATDLAATAVALTTPTPTPAGASTMPGGTSDAGVERSATARPAPRDEVTGAHLAAHRGAGPVAAEAPPTVITTTPTAFGHQLLGLVQRGEAEGRTSHRLSVRLDPPELGQVDVLFELRGDQVHVIVRPERAEGGALLLHQRERIAELFAREGLELSGFDIGAGAGGSDRDGNGNGTTGSRRYRELDLDLTHDVAFTVDRELRL